jgi:glycosyltransferase involved in cell wall biosynthesis
MKKVLISAFAVSPLRGSESAVGWNIAKGLSKYFKVYLIYCKETPSGMNFHKEISEELLIEPNDNLNLVPVSMPELSKTPIWLHDKGLWPFYYLAYNQWQKKAYKVAKKVCESEKIDLIYQLNYIGFREPGYLWKLNPPIIWGPVNGFHSVPLRFYKNYRAQQILAQGVKYIFNELQILVSIRPRIMAQKASLIYCVDKTAKRSITKWHGKTKLLQETGLTLQNEIRKEKIDFNTIELVWSGNITTGKALNLLLQALTEIDFKNRIHLTVIGDGPEKEWLQKKYSDLSKIICWVGWLSKEEAITIVKSKDILVHTSLKEGTPHVILEALSFGLPVICHDTCGMAEVINNQNGYLIPYLNSKVSVESLKVILKRLIDNPSEITDRNKFILNNNYTLSWDSKVDLIAKDIIEILNSCVASTVK